MSDSNKRRLVALTQVEDGVELKRKIDEIYAKAEFLDPSKYRLKTIRIGESDLTTPLLEKINALQFDDSQILLRLSNLQAGKADKTELANYRHRNVPIRLSDMDEALIEKIIDNFPYDDTELRGRVDAAEEQLLNKAEKSELDGYRKNDVLIGETDLTPELISKIEEVGGGTDYDDTELRGSITELQTNKADRTELDGFRKKVDKIDEIDLSDAVKNKLNAPVTDPYDDTELRGRIQDAENTLVNKANVTDLDTFRSKSIKITETDLDAELIGRLNEATVGYDDTAIKGQISTVNSRVDGVESSLTEKADAADLANYREKAVKIGEVDLDEVVKAKLNATYDDSEVRTGISNLEANKADKTELANYRKTADKIAEIDLDEATKLKLNATYDDTAVRDGISGLQTEVGGIKTDVSGLQTDVSGIKADKADKTQLADYREKAVHITETDLDVDLRYKINNSGGAGGSYDDTVLREEIADIRSKKADKTELTNYRLNTTSISELDLDESVKAKLNTTYDDAQLREEIHTVDQKIDTSIANKVDRTELDGYRSTSIKITEQDLDPDTQTKLNRVGSGGGYDDTMIRGEISNLYEVTDNLFSEKADRVQLNDYRSKAIKITAMDLDQDILDDLRPYDDQPVKADIQRLYEIKVDKDQFQLHDTLILGMQTQIDQLTASLAALEQRVRALEPLPPDAEPVIAKSVLDGQVDVPTSTKQVIFPLTGDDVLAIADAGLITSVPSGAITGSQIVGTDLVLTVSLNSGTAYTFTVGAGSIKNGNSTNSLQTSSTFTTAYDVPVVSHSAMNGSNGIPSLTAQVKFPVTGTNLSIVDESKITSVPDVITNKAIIGNEIVLYVTLAAGTEYSFTIEAGAVKNGNTLSANTITSTFTTVYPVPNVSVPAINGQVDVPIFTTEIRYPVTGTVLTLADASKITSTPAGAITKKELIGNEIVLTVNLAKGKAYTFTVGVGAVKNGATANNTAVSASFTTVYDEPVIANSSLNGNGAVPLTTAQVQYDITGTALSIADVSKITSSPTNIIGDRLISGGKLNLPLQNLQELTQYTITIAPGAIKNGSTLNTSTITTTFTTAHVPPVIANSALNGLTEVDKNLTEIRYGLTGVALTLGDTSKITMTPAGRLTSSKVEGNELILTVSLIAGTLHTVNILPGAVKNGATANDATVTTTFTTKYDNLTIANSVLHSNYDVPKSTTVIEYPLSVATGAAFAIADPTKITMDPSAISKKEIVSGKLRLTVALTAGTEYTVRIAPEALKNGNTLSTQTITTKFATVFDAPVISHSPLSGSNSVATSTKEIRFPVSGTSLGVNDSSKVTCNIPDTIGSGGFVGNELVINVTLKEATTYVFTIEAGAIVNGSTPNATFTETFTTTFPAPVVSQSSVDGNLTLPVATTEIKYPLSGTQLAIADALKITSTPSDFITNKAVVGNELVLTVSLKNQTAYTINVAPGAVKNGTTTNVNSVATTFTTEASAGPVVEWEFDFILPTPAAEYHLLKDPNWVSAGHVMTDEDVYGANLDGENGKVRLFYRGPVFTDGSGPSVMEEVPRDYFDSFDAPNSNGAWSWDSEGKVVWFKGGDFSSRYYKFIKYK